MGLFKIAVLFDAYEPYSAHTEMEFVEVDGLLRSRRDFTESVVDARRLLSALTGATPPPVSMS